MRIGSFTNDPNRWAFQLAIDTSEGSVPTMTMKFFSKGTEGPQSAETEWCLDDRFKGDWMITDFDIHKVADCFKNGKIHHRDILAACNDNEQRGRLICISLEGWPKILGHFNEGDLWRNPQPGVEELVSAVLNGRHLYRLRIWFLAPYEIEKFNRQCLSVFTRFLERRKQPVEDIYDPA